MPVGLPRRPGEGAGRLGARAMFDLRRGDHDLAAARGRGRLRTAAQSGTASGRISLPAACRAGAGATDTGSGTGAVVPGADHAGDAARYSHSVSVRLSDADGAEDRPCGCAGGSRGLRTATDAATSAVTGAVTGASRSHPATGRGRHSTDDCRALGAVGRAPCGARGATSIRRTREARRRSDSGVGSVVSSAAGRRSVHPLRATSRGARWSGRAGVGSAALRGGPSATVHSSECRRLGAAARHASPPGDRAVRTAPDHARGSGDGGAATAARADPRCDTTARCATVDARCTTLRHHSAGRHHRRRPADPGETTDQSVPRQRSERQGEAAGSRARVRHRRVLSSEA